MLQHDDKMRIWARSKNPEKWKICEWVTKHNANANDDMYACVTLHDTNVNDIIHDCVAPHDAHTCNHIHWASCAFSPVGCRVFIFTHTCTLAQVWVFHVISMAIHVCGLFALILPLYFLLYLSVLFLPLPQLHEVYGKPAQLLQRGCERLWRPPPLHIKWKTGWSQVWRNCLGALRLFM